MKLRFDTSRIVAAVRTQPAAVVLLGGLIFSQAFRLLFEALYTPEARPPGEPSIAAIGGLSVGLLVCLAIVGARVRLGQQLARSARSWQIGQLGTDAVPARYRLTDAPSALAHMVLTAADLLVLVVVDTTLHAPFVAVASAYLPEAQGSGVFVALIVVLAVALLVRLYRASRPVVAYAAWTSLDRFVPTAGFLSTGVLVAVGRGASASTGAAPSAAEQAATAVAAEGQDQAATILNTVGETDIATIVDPANER